LELKAALSIVVQCETAPGIDGLFQKLSEGGTVFMPLERYPFSEKFGWIAGKYGVSWQLNLQGK
jgi:predicted 3-demethylubiquinone-9 3-methyltransferase (glyoxalase superfamily)